MTVRPATYGSLPASHSFGWPGAAVFGYGLVCRWFVVASARWPARTTGRPRCSGPAASATMMKRCQVPLRSPSLSSEETLRNHSVT